MDSPRLRATLDLVREVSLQTDPQEMVRKFRARFAQLVPRDRSVSLSRRDLPVPQYRITRCSDWKDEINPWTQKHLLPLLDRGVLGELLYRGVPDVLEDFIADPDDPGYEYLQDIRSIIALPLYDGGEAVNMVVLLSRTSGGLDPEALPDMLLLANLFGRATHNLVLARQLQAAHQELDGEIHRIAQLQRALLPAQLPKIPGVGIAVHYAAAKRAGGDYFDFFDLGRHRWGLLVGDVSGHGPSAAMVMAMTRTLLHAFCCADHHPRSVMDYLNGHLVRQADRYPNTFVTLFYALFDAAEGTIQYASAGHNPPIVMRKDGQVHELDAAQSVPLGLFPDARFEETHDHVRPGDTVLMYTDGVTEALSPQGQMYGRDRLLACMIDPAFTAQAVIDCITSRLEGWTGDRPAEDDRTLVALRIKSLA